MSVKAGIRAAGGTPMEFNTVSISDGITMGSAGMRSSLVSREVIADSIELVTRGNLFDAIVILVGCDKTIPGAAMALARLDIPGLILYGGSIAPGRFDGRDVTIQDVFEAVGAHAAGRMSDAALCEVEDNACPGAGACGGQFTANTMATACEFLGLAAMGSGDVPATDPGKAGVAEHAGRLVMDVLKRGVRPSADRHARVARKRDRLGRRDRRFDQRGAAPDGDRARSGRHADARRLRPDQRDACRSSPISSRADASSPIDLHRAGGTRLVASRLQGRPARCTPTR